MAYYLHYQMNKLGWVCSNVKLQSEVSQEKLVKTSTIY